MYQGNDGGTISLYQDSDMTADQSSHYTSLWSLAQPQTSADDWSLVQVGDSLDIGLIYS